MSTRKDWILVSKFLRLLAAKVEKVEELIDLAIGKWEVDCCHPLDDDDA